jgi:hypothetical protein
VIPALVLFFAIVAVVVHKKFGCMRIKGRVIQPGVTKDWCRQKASEAKKDRSVYPPSDTTG